MTNLEKVYDKVSTDLGIPKYIIEEAFVSQFKTVVDVMKENKEVPIRLTGFGTFRVKPKRKYLLEKSIKEYKDGRQQNSGNTSEEI